MEPTHDDSTNKETDRFDIIPIIAHQIRSPLATIRLSNQTLLENKEQNLTEQQLYLLEQANKRADRIYELTEELLKAEEGTPFARVSDCVANRLESFIDELLNELNVAVQAKDLQVIRSYDTHAQDVSFDASLLSDTFTNLLDNAISYTPEGGTITVTTEYYDDTVVVTVSDTGPGIPPAEEDKLFKKFSRLAGGVEKRRDGLGLGLHIAKQAVELHGGTLRYEPNEPYGSSFVCTLPVTCAV